LLTLRDALLRVGKKRRGWVSLSSERAGVIEETALGSRFTYDAAWLARPDAKAISLTLPLRALPYESEGLHPFFENLLPEGWLLEQTRRKLGIPKSDAFGLLLATCGDCIGAVEITPAEGEEAA
jgi:serine/threonine-protein kinase HipA